MQKPRVWVRGFTVVGWKSGNLDELKHKKNELSIK